MPIFLAVAMTRQAISPRLAIRILVNMVLVLFLFFGDQSGMFPCLRHGFSSFLSFSITSERQMRLRVSLGRITSSIKPRAPATNGLAKRALYSAYFRSEER